MEQKCADRCIFDSFSLQLASKNGIFRGTSVAILGSEDTANG